MSRPPARRGGKVHRKTIEAIVRENPDLEVRSGGLGPERRVDIPGGNYRYPDIEFVGPNGPIYVNVGDVGKDGFPVAREWPALDDLGKVGEVVFEPKRY